MYQKLTTHEAIKQLLRDEDSNWSYWQADVIINYLETLEKDLEENFYFDVEKINAEFLGYPSAVEVVWDFLDIIGEKPFDGTQEEALARLNQNGILVLTVENSKMNDEVVIDTGSVNYYNSTNRRA